MNPITVYKASAGSGKTFTLAVQYIKLLLLAEGGDEYAHILAVTFTNKATTEMKDRIISQLYGIAHALPSSAPYFEALRKSLADEPLADATDDELRRGCARALHQILHDYNRFHVETIDSFFQTVLRGLAHELGLTANLQVEIGDAEVLSKAVDRIVDRLQEEPVVLDWLMSLVHDQIENNQRWDVTRRVKDFGRAIFNEDYLLRGRQLRQVLTDDKRLHRFIQTLRHEQDSAREGVQLLGKRLEASVTDAGIEYKTFSYGGSLATFVERLKAADFADLDVPARVQAWVEDVKGEGPAVMLKAADKRAYSPLWDVADNVLYLLGDTLAKLPDFVVAYNSAHQVLAHIKLLRLLDFIDHEVADINAETSRFNLAKTPILLNQMVQDSDTPFVFEKIGAKLHHMMIDEFQDTSRLQWHNFLPLLQECVAEGGRNLLVGDVKQSIYRWRGGDWRTLGYIDRELVPAPQITTLDTNFRSERNVIGFNNDFFMAAVGLLEGVSGEEERLLGGRFSFRTAYADVCQHPSPKRLQRQAEGCVCVTTLPTDAFHRRDEWEPWVLQDLIERVRQLIAAGLPINQMTILVRNNSDCQPIIRAFAEAGDMPRIVSDEAFLLSSSTAVGLLIEALRVIDDTSNEVAAYALRRWLTHQSSVDAVASISFEAFQERREALSMMPLYPLMELLYRILGLESIGGQDAYLFGFFDAVTDFLRTEAADIRSFLSFWDEKLARQAIPAGQVEGIRVVTIHKAKGLEFHTVLMPFCTWDIESDRASSLLWCVPTEAPYDELQLLPITPNPKVTPRSVFAHDYAEEHLLSRLDELNTLYVGFTRARCNLFAWAVGGDVSRERRTVGDLVYEAMQKRTALTLGEHPEEIPIFTEVNVDTRLLEPIGDSDTADASDASAAEATVYMLGKPMTQVDEDEKASRMVPRFESCPVAMNTQDMKIQFRQSNRSRDFIGQQVDIGEEDDEALLAEQSRQHQYVELGLLLHGVFQRIATVEDIPRVLDAYEHDGVITRNSADGTYVSVRRADLERWVRRGLRNPMVSSWFSSEWNLFTECSMVCRDDDGHTETMRPDRVLVSKDQSRVVVIDYKFGREDEEHHRQVHKYMEQLYKMYSHARIEGYLWYLYSGRVRPVK